MKTRAVLFVNEHPVTAQLPQSGIHRQRYRIDLASPIMVRASRVTHLADVARQHEGGWNGVDVSQAVVGVGNSAVVGEKLFVITFEPQTDRVAVGQVNRVSC